MFLKHTSARSLLLHIEATGTEALVGAALVSAVLLLAACGTQSGGIAPGASPASSAPGPQAAILAQPTQPPDHASAPRPVYATVPGQHIRFDHIGLEQGLSQSDVTAIVQDRLGFMWFGTEDGLNRYDGYEFKVFKHDYDDPTSLANNYILSLFVDSSAVLWVGTFGGGLDRYDRDTDTFIHYRSQPADPAGLPSDTIRAIAEDHEGVLWLATGKGVARLDRDRQRATNLRGDPGTPAPLLDGGVSTIYEDRGQNLWFGTGAGLLRYERSSRQYTQYGYDVADPASLSYDGVIPIYEDPAGRLWIGTSGGLNQLDAERQKLVRYRAGQGDAASLSSDRVVSIRGDRAGALLIGTHGGGVDRLDHGSGQFTHYDNDPGDPSSLSDNIIRTVYEDAGGILWIGTWSGGVNRYDPGRGQFVHYRHEPKDPASLISSVMLAVCEERPGILWIGTDRGLDRLDRATGRAVHYLHDEADAGTLSDNYVRATYVDSRGALWVGTRRGLNRLDPGTSRFVRYRYDAQDATSLANDVVSAIYEDPSGTLWIGTGGGLDRLDRATGKFEHYRPATAASGSHANPTVNAIYPSHSGELWLATANGLGRFDPRSGQWTVYEHSPADGASLGVNNLLGVYEDPAGIVWVGTVTGGLDRLDPAAGRFTHYRAKNGLPDDTIYAILPDNAGFLWLSTNNGLARFDPRSETFRNYDAGDGLQSDEFNQGAYYRNAAGELFFGGVNGLSVFDPATLQDNAYLPPVALTSFSQGGRDLKLGGATETLRSVSLGWPGNYFEFEFAGLSYAQPEKNRYAYRLEGFDKAWNLAGSRRFGSYTNLPGGTYTLRLKASNADGLWNEAGASLVITVVPPLWQTWPFRVGLLLALLGIVAGSYRWRLRDIEARNRALESQVAERTLELARRTADVEAHFEAEKRRAERFRLIAEGGRRVASVLDVQEVLGEVVALVHETLDCYHVGIGLIEGDELVYRVGAGMLADNPEFGFSPPRLRVGREGLSGWVAANGQPLLVPDVMLDPRYVRMEGSRTCSELVVPIIDKGQVIGVLDAQSDHRGAFDESDIAMLQLLANQAGTAIDNARLYERAQELAAMRERTRLARDLHDAVTQTLFSASLLAEVLPSTWDVDREQGHEMLRDLRQLTRGALAEMRTLLLELRPAALMEARLDDLLRQLAEAVSGRTGLPVEVTIEGEADLPKEVHVVFYRIAQEALNNVVKHARAHNVSVTLRGSPDSVTLNIVDDGRGFDTGRVPPERLGLGIMRERAQAAGAALQIQSTPGRGTVVAVCWENSRRSGQ